ncbi:GNAT family N-acetyltransferase [Leucobacter chromiiresistens]|uniref:GNAT family N-acetyltransferase n=1 Tax=Leucobacter chromiiresistens TaxID=1079994 RepID=UPI000A61F9EA
MTATAPLAAEAERVAEAPLAADSGREAASAGAHPEAASLAVRIVHPDDALARPLLADLEREYDARYGVEVFGEAAAVELNRYPVESFVAPTGAFLVLLLDGAPVSGGAFMRYDDRTAEFKRVWTRADLRGRGLARRVLSALEREAARLGYERVYLTTGPRQPEAVALYLRAGYAPLFDPRRDAADIGIHAFEKPLPPAAADPDRAAPDPDRAAPDPDRAAPAQHRAAPRDLTPTAPQEDRP